MPLFKPEHNWSTQHRYVISSRVAMAMTLHKIRLDIFPIAIGRTPRHLSSATKRLDISALMSDHSTILFHNVEGSLANVTLWIHQDQHCPESAGLPSPVILISIRGGSSLHDRKASADDLAGSGCISLRTSRTVFGPSLV